MDTRAADEGLDGGPASGSSPPEGALGSKLLVGLVLGLVVYGALALWADLGAMSAALEGFDWRLVPLACGLSFLNYVVRFARWERYRCLVGVRLERSTSFLIYLAGLSLTVTPGKMGEAFKSWLIRRVEGSPVHRTAPIVVAERFTDLLSFLVLIAIGGLATQPDHAWIFWGTLGLCAALLAVVGSPRLTRSTLGLCARLPLIGPLAPKLEASFDSTRVLLAPRELPFATLVSTIGWGLECAGFWLIANSLLEAAAAQGVVVEGAVPLLFATYAFALSAVAGAVAIIAPGGLGITEGTLSGLLGARYQALGLSGEAARAGAASATVLIRLCTLWFAVACGLVALGLFQRAQRARETRQPGTDQAPGGGA